MHESQRRRTVVTSKFRTNTIFERACRAVVADACRPMESLEQRQLLTLTMDYRFDEGSGDTIIDSEPINGGPQDGFINAGVTRIPGRVGTGALNFDGTGTATVPGELSEYLGLVGSIAFWIRTTQTGTTAANTSPAVTGTDDTATENDAVFGWLDNTGRIAMTINGNPPTGGVNTVRSVNPINNGSWQHVVMTHDADTGQMKLYVNGILQATGNGPIGAKNTLFRDLGGARVGVTFNYLTGALDEVRVYDHVLDDAEAASLFNPSGQAPTAPTNLVATQTASRGVVLSWTSTANNESGFRILQSTDGTTFTEVGTTGADTTTFTARGLTPATPYSFRVVAFNPAGASAPSNTLSVTTNPAAPASNGTGLTGIYFDEGGVAIPGSNPAVVDPASNFRGKIAIRQDPTVNFDWGTGAPHPEIGPNNFSTRWLGSVRPLYTETYTFFIETDDGGYLSIDLNNDGDFADANESLISDPTFHGLAGNERASIGLPLTAGQNYNIRFEQFEGGGGAGARLRWDSLSTGKEIIPASQLFPVSHAAAPTGTATLTAAPAGPDAVTLTWTDPGVANALGYRVERRAPGQVDFVEIATVGDADTYTDGTVLPGTQYSYRIRPFNLTGDGAYSNIASATTPPRVVRIQYNLDEGSGTTASNSAPGGGFPGTLMNGATWVAGNTGGTDDAVQFAGGTSDQHIQTDELNTILGGTSSLTSWIKTTQSGNNTFWQAPGITGVEQAGAGNDIFWGWINVAGQIGFQVGNGTAIQSPRPINDGQWHHIGMTRNSTTGEIKLYVDGELIGTATHQTGAVTSSFNSFGVISRVNQDLSVVAKADLPDSVWLNGALDDIRVFDSVLTENEIRQMIPLIAPTGVTAAGGDRAVQVSWAATPNADSYNVKRATTAGGPYTTVGTNITDTTFLDTGLTNGTTYYYVVSAVNEFQEGPNSAEVSAVPQLALPTAPVVTATPGVIEVRLDWAAVPFASTYTVRRGTTAGGPYTQIGTTTTPSFVDDTVNPGTAYFYVVSATNPAGEGPNSAEVAATTGNRVIHYVLDEGTGTTVTNASGGAFNGTLVNGPTWVAGDYGEASDSAVQFAGGTSDQSLDTDDLSTLLGGTASVTAWIKTTQSGNDTFWQAPGITGVEQAGAGNDIFWGWLNVAGQIGLKAGDGANISSPNPVNDGQWHHIGMTRNATSGLLVLYVDGVEVGRTIGTTGQMTSFFNSFGVISRVNQDLTVVPKDTLPDTVWLNGALDDIMVFDSVLSATEVAMIAGITPTPEGITLNGTAGNDNWHLKRNGTQIEVRNNADGSGAPVSTHALGEALTLNGLDGDDTVTVDMSGGDINLSSLTITGANGTDKIRLTNGDNRTLTLGALPTLNGEYLDLGTADLKLTGVALSAVEPLLASARNGTPRWQGPGIGTSSAGTDTGLAPVQQGADTLVKFSYNGDANGDGRINADDYFEIDSGFLAPPANPTYADGDFNFDNAINADDYFLIDSAFLGQSGILAASSSAAAAVTSTSATPAIPDNQGTKRAKRVANDNSALFGSKRIEKRSAKVRR